MIYIYANAYLLLLVIKYVSKHRIRLMTLRFLSFKCIYCDFSYIFKCFIYKVLMFYYKFNIVVRLNILDRYFGKQIKEHFIFIKLL